MQIQIHHQGNADAYSLLIFPLLKDRQLEAHLRELSSFLDLDLTFLQEEFCAAAKETLLHFHRDQRVILLGLGEDPDFPGILNTCRSFFYQQRYRLPNRVAINLRLCSSGKLPVSRLTEAIVNGSFLSAQDLGYFKQEKPARNRSFTEHATLAFWVNERAEVGPVERAAHAGLEVGRTQGAMMALVNTPSNKKTPEDMARVAQNSAETHGFTCMVLDKPAIREVGLEALLAVNQGSPTPPAFIIMEYHSKPRSNRTIGLVGKGVTFDTGGLSIKSAANMHHMKSDMGGAAAVLGVIELAAKLQLGVNLIGIIPATDNSVDAAALKPGDVIPSYSGKTIEVINTDAEGRLILADGLSYLVRNYQADQVIDLATLTGSAIQTLGYHAACLFSNDDQLAESLYTHGQACGERVWRLPIWGEYGEDLRSDVADLKNYSGRPISGAIAAAKFLEAFIDEHPSWAHLDIAGMAYKDSEFALQKSATGFGIRLLLEYLLSLE